MSASSTSIGPELQFGDLLLDIELCEIIYEDDRGERRVKIEPRLVDVAKLLYENQGAVVSREKLILEVWKSQVVSANAISRSISQLRKLFALVNDNQAIIETIPKKGYRLIQPSHLPHSRLKNRQSKGSRSNNAQSVSIIDPATFKILLFAIFSLSIVIGYAVKQFSPQIKPTNFTQTTLTTTHGIEKLAKFSPDDVKIAFVHAIPQSGVESIFVMNKNGKQKTQLTDRKETILNLAWRPDSRAIVYSQWDSIHNRQCSIRLVELNASYEILSNTKLLDCSKRSLLKLAWDKKGEKIYFNERKSFDRPYAIYSYSLNSQRISQLTLPKQDGNLRGDYFLSGNSSGENIAVARYVSSEQSEISVYNTDDDSIVSANHLLKNVDGLSWFGHQKKLLVSKVNQLYTYDYNISKLEPFYPKANNAFSFHVSSETNELLFQQYYANSDLVAYSLKQPKVIKDIANSTANEYMPSHANNIDAIAFLSNASGKNQIWLKAENGETSQISNSPVSLGLSPLKWSPDDSQILFQHNDEIFQLSINTGKIERLIDLSHKAFIASWSTDGKSLYYSSEKSGEWQVWGLDLLSGEHKQITKEGGYSVKQHNKGDLLVSRLHQLGLWRLIKDEQSATGYSDAIKVIEEFSGTNWLSWELIDNSVYYFSANDGNAGIVRYDLLESSEQLIFPLKSWQQRYFSIKGDELILTQNDENESSIEILVAN